MYPEVPFCQSLILLKERDFSKEIQQTVGDGEFRCRSAAGGIFQAQNSAAVRQARPGQPVDIKSVLPMTR
jgi:hypothetical protein